MRPPSEPKRVDSEDRGPEDRDPVVITHFDIPDPVFLTGFDESDPEVPEALDPVFVTNFDERDPDYVEENH